MVVVTVALVSTLLTATVSLLAARHLFTCYLARTAQLQAENWAETFAAYYRNNGSFDGIENLMPPGQHGMGRGRMQHPFRYNRVLLVDTRNRVLFDSTHLLTGGQLSPEMEPQAVPVTVGSRLVGKVLVSSPGWQALNTLEASFIDSLTFYSLLTGIVTAMLALGLGFLMARPISRPIQSLIAATHRVARGELNVRVKVEGEGEIRQLLEDFNNMAQSLQKTETMRRNLTADVAHELRTPLAILRGNLESLQAGAIQATPENIVSLHDEVIRINKLVNDMETLALAETGNLVLHVQPTRFQEVLDRLAPVVMEAEARNLQLVVDVDPDLPPVAIDADRILQVMVNLLLNAINHSPPEGKITVQIHRKAENIQVAVSDEGPGIPAEELPFIFERFYRVDKARSRKEGGMGLGLAIARSYVEAHGGRIWVESIPPRGSTFYFTIPVA